MNRWAEIEFGGAKLGDPRRTRRLIEIASARAQRPSASLPQSFEDKAGLKGMYEFCDNEQVRREAVLASHYQATEERLGKERIVLAVQDTTEVDFTHHPATQGLGVLHNEAHQGFLRPTTLAVTPSRLALGLMDQQLLYRDAEDFGKKHRRRQRPIEEKESRKWLEGLRATAQMQARCPQSRLVRVGDREADVYDLFVLSGELKQEVLVRAAWNRRVEHEESYLWDHLENQPLAGTLEITVPRRGHAPARTASCAVRSAQLRLKPPRHRTKEHLPVIPVHGVLVQEEAPPPGVEGIEGLLRSTVPVLSFEDACERVQWYTCRWVIEIYHKVLKSGCKIEERQFETAARLEGYLAIDSVVAWRVLGLTMQSRETPEMSCEAFLEPEEWQALSCYVNKTLSPPTQPPTLKQTAVGIAQLGGFLNRKGDGNPGVTVMWRGFQRLYDIVAMWRIFNHANDRVN